MNDPILEKLNGKLFDEKSEFFTSVTPSGIRFIYNRVQAFFYIKSILGK